MFMNTRWKILIEENSARVQDGDKKIPANFSYAILMKFTNFIIPWNN